MTTSWRSLLAGDGLTCDAVNRLLFGRLKALSLSNGPAGSSTVVAPAGAK
jgi:hypothetical protein